MSAGIIFSCGKKEEPPQNTDSQGSNTQDVSGTVVSEPETPVNFDEQFANGEITADEYVIKRLDTKNQDMYQRNLNDFIGEHIDELSADTQLYYLKSCSIENMAGLDQSDEKKSSSIKAPFVLHASAEESHPGGFNILSSKNGRFMIWYRTEGPDAYPDELANSLADALEDTTDEYDMMFGTTYSFESKILSKGSSYEKVMNLLAINGFTEDDFTHSMQIFLFENNSAIATYNAIPTFSKNEPIMSSAGVILGDFMDRVGYTFDGSIILPYVLGDAGKMRTNPEEALQVINHELFHHYQWQIIPKAYENDFTGERFAKESTANLASALVSRKTTKSGFLNTWSAFVRSRIDEFSTDGFLDYNENNNKDATYIYYLYLYEYMTGLENGREKMTAALTADDFFKSLEDNVHINDLTKIQKDFMTHLVVQDYTNMNLYADPNVDSELPYRQKMDFTDPSAEEVKEIDLSLPPNCCGCYLIEADHLNDCSIEFLREDEYVVASLIGISPGGGFEIMDEFYTGYDLPHTFTADGNIHEKYWFVVGNSSLTKDKRYTVLFKHQKHPEETGGGTEADDKADYKDVLIHGGKVIRSNLPESGNVTFISTWNLDEDKQNVYITYYFEGDEITREVFSNYFVEGTPDSIIQGYVSDVADNPGMYKQNYILKGNRLICEYTKEQLELEDLTVDDLVDMMNGEYMMLGQEVIFDFVPEL